MKKKCKVVMLPTENEANSLYGYKDRSLLFSYNAKGYKKTEAELEFTQHFHLYLISDDEIQQMDHYYDPEMNIISQRTLSADQYEGCKKVIASTDLDVYYLSKGVKAQLYPSGTGLAKSRIPLPAFSEDFIKAYVEANGIDEVMVEYEDYDHEYYRDKPVSCKYKLKLRDDNTVITSEIKKVFTYDDITHALAYGHKAAKEGKSHADALIEFKESNLK